MWELLTPKMMEKLLKHEHHKKLRQAWMLFLWMVCESDDCGRVWSGGPARLRQLLMVDAPTKSTIVWSLPQMPQGSGDSPDRMNIGRAWRGRKRDPAPGLLACSQQQREGGLRRPGGKKLRPEMEKETLPRTESWPCLGRAFERHKIRSRSAKGKPRRWDLAITSCVAHP